MHKARVRHRAEVLYRARFGESGMCGAIQEGAIQPIRRYTKNARSARLSMRSIDLAFFGKSSLCGDIQKYA